MNQTELDIKILEHENYLKDARFGKRFVVCNEVFEECDFSNADLYDACLVNCYFIRCDFSNTNLMYTNLENCVWNENRCHRIILEHAYLKFNQFICNDFEGGYFRGANFELSTFLRDMFNDNEWELANLNNCCFRKLDLSYEDLSCCDLIAASFHSVGMRDTKLPKEISKKLKKG